MSENTPPPDRSQLWQAPIDTSASALSAALGAQDEAAKIAGGISGLTNDEERAFAQKKAEEAQAYAAKLQGEAFGLKQQVDGQRFFVEQHNKPIEYAIQKQEEEKAGNLIKGALGLAATVAVMEAGAELMTSPTAAGMGQFGLTSAFASVLAPKAGQGITFDAKEPSAVAKAFGETAEPGKTEPVTAEMSPSTMFNARTSRDFMNLAILGNALSMTAQPPEPSMSATPDVAAVDTGLDTANPTPMMAQRRPSQAAQFMPSLTPKPPSNWQA